MSNEQVLLDDDFWTVKTFGPRYFTAVSKCHDEHRIYYSYDAMERDFSSALTWWKRRQAAQAGDIS